MWEKIWPRTTFRYINLHERDVIFKYLHDISTIWYNRGRNVEIDPILFKTTVLNHHRLLSLILKDKQKHVFTEKYCNNPGSI